ncbi:MAG: penicillin acylase family protein [Anaerolineales bacterium]|nr:penicillin acylase family protein [Anaerolineales bacterium]
MVKSPRFISRAVFLTLALLLLALVSFIFNPRPKPNLNALLPLGEQYDVRILRDEWGIPHVFGVTDADAAFGLAYAHAEDDFLTIQQITLAARGRLATVYGPDAAPNDYMVQLLRIWDVTNAKYETDLTPETRALLQGYADGLNFYAAKHPGEVLPGVFPMSGIDLAAASVHRSPLFFGLDDVLGDLFKDTRQSEISPRPEGVSTPSDVWQVAGTSAKPIGRSGTSEAVWEFGIPFMISQFLAVSTNTNELPPLLKLARTPADLEIPGSNVFAAGPVLTSDGSTFLAVNSHQPWEGPVAWYEAHVHSEEGWDMTGGLFPGAPVIILGHNRDLGWGFTVNHPDLVDVYVLDINPDNPDQYRFDGEWLELEVRESPLYVKLMGNLVWPVQQEFLWSVYGPVIRRDHGTYAIRYAGYGRVDIFQQLYQMNKATNFNEWRTALANGGLPMFNVGYADKAGNVYYVYNGMLPVREDGWDWSLYLPGDTSANLWTATLPFDQLPQVLNPPSGFVFNANSTPFQTTTGTGNPDPGAYPVSFGIETRMTNRALRGLELFGIAQNLTLDQFIQIKWDMQYSIQSDVARYRDQLLTADVGDDPNARAGLDILREWDLSTAPNRAGASLMMLTLNNLNQRVPALNVSALVGVEVPVEVLAQSYLQAVDTLVSNFGSVNVPWENVNRLVRGDVNFGVGGGPDIIHAVYGELLVNGTFRGVAGDGVIVIAAWDPAGNITAYSLHQYGSATDDPASSHYADQAPLFVTRVLRPEWFSEVDIRSHLAHEYRPGDE